MQPPRKIPKSLRIRNIKRFIANNGLFKQLENHSNTVNGFNRTEIYFLRSILDRATLDVLASNHKEDRLESLEWFCTSSFDQLCHDAGLEPDYVFDVMQGVFDVYKQSPYGKDWNRPNVNERTSVT